MKEVEVKLLTVIFPITVSGTFNVTSVPAFKYIPVDIQCSSLPSIQTEEKRVVRYWCLP